MGFDFDFGFEFARKSQQKDLLFFSAKQNTKKNSKNDEDYCL